MSILEEDERRRWTRSAGIDRRSFVGYVLAGTTLVAAADFALGSAPARAAAGSPARRSRSSTTSTTSSTDTCRPTANLITVDRPQRRHGVVRAAAVGERPGDHDLDGDDHRRGARAPGQQGRRSPWPTRGRSCSSTSSPAARRPPRRRTPRSGWPRPSPRARCWRPRRSCSAPRSSKLVAKGGVDPGAGRATASTYGELRQGRRRDARPAGSRSRSRTTVDVPGDRRRPEPARRAGRGDRQEDLHHRPQGQGRAADHGLPGAHAQRHAEAAAQPRRSRRRCPASRTSRSSTPAWRCAPTPSASASTRCGRCGSTGRPGRSPGSPTATSWPSSSRPSCRSPPVPDTPLAQTVEGDVHLLLPQQLRARHQRGGRRRPRRPGRGLVGAEDADRRAGRDRRRRSGCRRTRSRCT